MEDRLYFIRLDEVVIRFDEVESQNDILTVILILLSLLFIAAVAVIVSLRITFNVSWPCIGMLESGDFKYNVRSVEGLLS